MGEDEAPVNAPKWTTAGYKGSLKTSVEKYTRRTIASSPEPTPPTAPPTAPVIDVESPTAAAAVDEATAGPSTDDVFFLNEDILVDENVLNINNSSEETDKGKKDSSSSEYENDSSSSEESSSGEEDDDDKNIRRKTAVLVVMKRKMMIAIKKKM